jgi:hypothetical protein
MADATSKKLKLISLQDVVSILTVAGVAWYTIIGLSYATFYGRLSIAPSDVGLSYAAILASSIGSAMYGLLIVIGVLVGMFILVAIGEWIIALRRSTPFYIDASAFFKGAVQGVGVALLILSFIVLPSIAFQATKSVRDGTPVSTKFGPIDVLNIRADVAYVEAVSKSGENPAIDKLMHRKLLYLGQNGGTAVFYDSASDNAIYVPTSEIVLVVDN